MGFVCSGMHPLVTTRHFARLNELEARALQRELYHARCIAQLPFHIPQSMSPHRLWRPHPSQACLCVPFPPLIVFRVWSAKLLKGVRSNGLHSASLHRFQSPSPPSCASSRWSYLAFLPDTSSSTFEVSHPSFRCCPSPPQVCLSSVGVLGDVCRNVEGGILPYCDDLVSIMLLDLSREDVNRTIKPQILSGFGDIALVIGEAFEKYLEPVLRVLKQAMGLSVTMQSGTALRPSSTSCPSFLGVCHPSQSHRVVLRGCGDAGMPPK